MVHHFGFGTTAEVLKAGLPSIPVLHIFDQKIRAKQIHKLGYAFRPVNKDKFTAKDLSEAIMSMKNDADLITRCSKVGEEISRENGIEKAVSLIHQTFKV